MKFITILVLLCLVLISFQRVTKKNKKSNLKAKNQNQNKAKTSMSTATLFTMLTRGVLDKGYGGELIVNDGGEQKLYLQASELNFIQPKGLAFRTEDNQDTTNSAMSKQAIRYLQGKYYLPYIKMKTISFTNPWLAHDYITFNVAGQSHKFRFWYDSWNKGSGESLTQNLESFRTRRINEVKKLLGDAAGFAANYVSAKAGFDASSKNITGIETQLAGTQTSIDEQNKKKSTEMDTVNRLQFSISSLEPEVASLRKTLENLQKQSNEKNQLIASLTSTNQALETQKNSGTADAQSFKKQMDELAKSFETSMSSLAVEVASDVEKVNKSKDAILKEGNLENFKASFNTILP